MTDHTFVPDHARGENHAADAAMQRFVGQRIRQRRLALGLEINVLAERLRLPASRIADQESGAARLPAEALLALAAALRVPLRHFYNPEPASPPPPREMHESTEVQDVFQRISDPRVRDLVLEGLRALARAG